MVRKRTFLDFAVGENEMPLGRVVFELYTDLVPKTSENFRALCTGELGASLVSGVPLSYKGSIIHRSIANFMVQGGDFTKHNGKGGESIYGEPFGDEDLSMDIDKEGLLVMANKGPDTNGSQWFVTLRPCPHLKGKHVVFGRVVSGYETIVAISEKPADAKDRPLEVVRVIHSGELELKKAPAGVAAPPKRARSASASHSSKDSDEDRKERKRKSQRDASEDRHRKSKHRSRKEKEKERRPKSVSVPLEETEAELDVRLEREENARLAAAKARELEEIKARAPVVESSSGIRYKGRGRMKFKDPEISGMHGW